MVFDSLWTLSDADGINELRRGRSTVIREKGSFMPKPLRLRRNHGYSIEMLILSAF